MSSSLTKGSKKKGETKKSVVDHTYRDYSHVEITDLVDDYKGVNEELFPSKLHVILSTPEYARIITWKPHGRAWIVIDKAMFTSIVLPRYFNHCNFESFNRSVNGWGFKRLLREGPDEKSYYHELFLRGRPILTCAMTRLINPGKRLPNKAGEPDFYDISRKYPLPAPPSAFPSEAEEVDIHSKRAPSPIFTPPLEEKRLRLSNSQGTHRHYGYNPNVPMHHSQPPPYSEPPPYSRPPPYSQHPPYSQPPPYSEPPPYSQHPPYPQPPHYAQHPPYSQLPPNYFQPTYGTYHSPHGQFYHPYTDTPPSGPPNVPFHHPNQWGPANMPPREWNPSSPQHYYSHPPAHATVQHHEEYSPERMMPILHSNQSSLTARLDHTIAKSEVHEIDERKPAAHDILTPDQDQALRIVDPPLDGSPLQFLEDLELRSTTMKTWQSNEENPFNENLPYPAPDKFSMHDAYEAPETYDQGYNKEKDTNPLDIDNFYDSSTEEYNKTEWVAYPPRKNHEEEGKDGWPEPEH